MEKQQLIQPTTTQIPLMWDKPEQTNTKQYFPRVAIVGSRNYANHDFVLAVIESIRAYTNHIVSGGAEGVDTWAEKAAESYGMQCSIHLPDKKTQIPQRYFDRNRLIVDEVKKHGGIVIAISFTPTTAGTNNTIQYAISQEVPVIQMCGTAYNNSFDIRIPLWYNIDNVKDWIRQFNKEILSFYPKHHQAAQAARRLARPPPT